jgi:hypothetical protein
VRLGKHKTEMEIENMSDEYLKFEYNNLISDQVVANAVMAVLLKLEIERRRSEVLEQQKREYIVSEYISKIVREV